MEKYPRQHIWVENKILNIFNLMGIESQYQHGVSLSAKKKKKKKVKYRVESFKLNTEPIFTVGNTSKVIFIFLLV